jgi:aminobenzoyl-glutamate transport protein
MEKVTTKPKKGFLYYVEKSGNALPHPAILFALLALTVLVLSAVGSLLGWGGIHPATGNMVEAENLLSRDGIHRIILEMVTNYTSFAPLGIVMVALLGIGVAETSGLLKAAINSMLVKAPKQSITIMVIFTGIISSIASDMGYVLIIPMAGVIFHSLGRHPFAGLAAAFAGVSAGFSANIIITPLDPMLAGLSTEAARIVDPNYYVMPTANYFFLAAATFVLSIVGAIVCVKWVEPRLGKYHGDVEREEIVKPTALEKKGLRRAGFVFLAWFILFAIGLIPENGILRGNDGSVLGTPLLRGIVAVLFLIGVSAGAVYGFTVGKFKKAADIITGMNDNFKALAVYLVLTFFAAQFVAWFRWSNLGMLLAIGGAGTLQNLNLGLIPLILIFTVFTAFLNIFIGSASAKWAILAPVYIPIFMLLGYSPEFGQAVYHAGDNATNIISPLLPYFALIIVYFQKYDKNAGIGTIMANMMPYSITFFIAWVGLLIAWVLLGIPLGPDVSLYYNIGG